jgi:hypothetical protein
MTRSVSCGKTLGLLGMAVLLAAWSLGPVATPARAELIRHSDPGNLFHNYYVPPVGYGSVGAQMYPCPRPTPLLVGHTYITYPPLAPDQFMYRHSRVYWTQHEDAPATRTSVRWGWRPW